MTSFHRQAAALERHLEIAPFVDRLRALAPEACDAELWRAILGEAARFSGEVLAPLNGRLDRDGCSLVDGRVVTSPAYRDAWAAFAAGGWLTLSLPEAIGGQALPLVLTTACEELFHRACPAFAMLATPTRTAAALLERLAEDAVRGAWAPQLASGAWTASICISEPDAGSDVGRIRTVARRDEDGRWRVTGEKCWISFGDHDLSKRVGHCMLARTSDAPGVRGLSLFLTPNLTDYGGPNGVTTRRVEEKLGLHGSPTCVLDFDEAEAILIGEPGRGLQQLFHMLLLMRLSCGSQGVGVAAGAAETALAYACERRQGGAPEAPPPPISEHADVQRQLLSLHGRVETARGLALAAAAAMDLAELEPDAGWSALAQWLLPVVKEVAGRTAFDVASDAIQVLGGAGYTREWPLEQALRDARVFPIFEGATGIQALDMLHRRLWRDRGAGLALFLEAARADVACAGPDGARLAAVLDELEAVSASLAGWEGRPRDAEAGAVHYLNLCGLAATGWIAVRLVAGSGGDAVGRRLAAAARAYLAELGARAKTEAALGLLGASRLEGFADLAAG